jgi:ribose transport system permease protein
MSSIEQLSRSPLEPEPVAAEPRRSRLQRVLEKPETGVGIGLLAIIVVFALLNPSTFATTSNLTNLLADSSLLIVLAMATTFVLITANLDLSIGSVIAFSEVVAVKAMLLVGGDTLLTCLLGLIVALVSGIAWGTINGVLIARAGIPPFITTLGTLGMALGGAQLISDGNDLADVPASLVTNVGVASVAGIPVPAIVALAVFAVAAWTLRSTRFGRYTYAIGSDRIAAARAGIDVERHLIKVYAIAGAAYGLTAFLALARFATTSIGGHNADALNAIAAVALGGTSLFGGVGTALGSLIGVFVPGVLQNGLVIASVPPFWQQVAVGAALLLAVYADQVRRGRR